MIEKIISLGYQIEIGKQITLCHKTTGVMAQFENIGQAYKFVMEGKN